MASAFFCKFFRNEVYYLLVVFILVLIFLFTTHQNRPKNCKITDGQFKESKLAHRLLDGLEGVEIGASFHNPFCLNTINVDFTENLKGKLEQEISGTQAPIDVIAPGDALPFANNSYDFIISSHVFEHFYDPIKAVKEWLRVIRPNGYIFMIIPHLDRIQESIYGDQKKNRTTLMELIERHLRSDSTKLEYHGHHSHWITQDLLELCAFFGWNVVEWQDVDDKVGNGFTIVVQK